MKNLVERIGVDLYRLVLVSIFSIASLIDVRVFYGGVLYFGFCVPGIIDRMFNGEDTSGNRSFFVPGRFKFAYRTFVLIWNGFGAKR